MHFLLFSWWSSNSEEESSKSHHRKCQWQTNVEQQNVDLNPFKLYDHCNNNPGSLVTLRYLVELSLGLTSKQELGRVMLPQQ
jgi:hypothetical protein